MRPNACWNASHVESGSHRYGTVESTSVLIPWDMSDFWVLEFEYVIDCSATTSCLVFMGANVKETSLETNRESS